MVLNEKFFYGLISVVWASKYHCFHCSLGPIWCRRDPTQPNNLFAVNVYVEFKKKSMAKVEKKRKEKVKQKYQKQSVNGMNPLNNPKKPDIYNLSTSDYLLRTDF